MSRNMLPFTVRAALAAWLTPHRTAIENPTPTTYKPYGWYAAEATKALTYPIDQRHVLGLTKSLGWSINTNLRRSLASREGLTTNPKFVNSGRPTLKYATLCTNLHHLETRVAHLETQLGIIPQSPRE